jgi:hypothetical protein
VGPLMQRVEEEIKKSQPPQGTTEADNET